MTASGLIWWSTPSATVGLDVRDGRVVDCPPYARRWAQGRDARELWREGKARGVRLEWIPDEERPRRARAPGAFLVTFRSVA